MELNLEKIQAELKRLGWTKTRLSKEMGMSRQAIHYYFTSKISLRKAERLAQALNLDPKDLLK